MKKLYVIFVLFSISINLIGQKGSSIKNPISITLADLKNFNPPFDTSYIVFDQDSIKDAFELKLNCFSWEIIYPINDFKITRFDISGDITATQKQILEGYCFCSSCSKNKRTINTFDKNNVVIKMINCQNYHQINILIPPQTNLKKWHEQKWTKGQKINLENLLFYPNKSMFLNESFVELEELFLLLDKQKQLKIDIIGHVNGPNSKNTDEFQKLSENRSKAVYDYLIKRGISSNRINYMGFGNSQMIFPKPNSEEQMKLNRRVEVVIL